MKQHLPPLPLGEGEQLYKQSGDIAMTRIQDGVYRGHPSYDYFVLIFENQRWKRQTHAPFHGDPNYRTERLPKRFAENLYADHLQRRAIGSHITDSNTTFMAMGLWGYILWLAREYPDLTIPAPKLAAFYREHCELGRYPSEVAEDLGLPVLPAWVD